jgi:hypothetical protein
MDKHLVVVDLDKLDDSFKQLLEYKYINLQSEGKDNIFMNKDYAVQLMTDFLRIQVSKGLLIPKEGYDIDTPTPSQMREVSEFLKQSGF